MTFLPWEPQLSPLSNGNEFATSTSVRMERVSAGQGLSLAPGPGNPHPAFRTIQHLPRSWPRIPGATRKLVVTQCLSNKCWLSGHTIRVAASGSELPSEENKGTRWQGIHYEIVPPWGGGGGWWQTEGAGFKTIKSIWYGLLQCFEIFERDIVWRWEGAVREGGCIYTVKSEP